MESKLRVRNPSECKDPLERVKWNPCRTQKKKASSNLSKLCTHTNQSRAKLLTIHIDMLYIPYRGIGKCRNRHYRQAVKITAMD